MKVWDGMGFATSEESGVVVMFLKYLQLYNYNDLYSEGIEQVFSPEA